MIHHSFKYYVDYRIRVGKRGMVLLRKLAHDLISEIIGYCFEFLCKIHLCKPCVIVMMDGGICSQMNQYLLGQIYAERGENVGYDLSWYKKCGMDVDHRYARLYEIESLFPSITPRLYGRAKTWFYRMFLLHTSLDQKPPKEGDGLVAPIYLGGYYSKIDDVLFRDQFERLYNGVERSSVSYQWNTSKLNQHKCAVHVRRGDLARGDNPWYGGVTDDYFFRAIAYVENRYPGTKYYFFSDEMDYVEQKLVPSLTVEFQLVKESHKAYEDLLLIASCETIIASQGSFGKYAAMMNKSSELILQDDEYARPWLARKMNVVVL